MEIRIDIMLYCIIWEKKKKTEIGLVRQIVDSFEISFFTFQILFIFTLVNIHTDGKVRSVN